MFLFKLCTLFAVMVSLLLIAVILLQEPKERFLPSGGSWGGQGAERIGINQKADFLEKATWILISLLLALTLLSTIFLKQTKKEASSLPAAFYKSDVQTEQVDQAMTDGKPDQADKKNAP